MFKVKSAVEGTPARDLVMRDFKDFNMNGKLVGIGQLEVIDLAVFDEIKPDLEADIAKLKEEGGRHSVFLLLTDIMKEGSQMLIASDDASLVEQAYGEKPEDGKVWPCHGNRRSKEIRCAALVPSYVRVPWEERGMRIDASGFAT